VATLARHESSVFRFAYTQKIRVWGAQPAPDATRPGRTGGAREQGERGGSGYCTE